MYIKKIQVASVMFHGTPRESIAKLTTLSHTYIWKICKNFRNRSEIPGNFRNLRKCFKTIFEEFIRLLENLRNLVQNDFKIFERSSEVFGNFRKTLELFGSLRKILETVQNLTFYVLFLFLKIVIFIIN